MGYDYLSATERANLSGDFDTVFQTLSRNITVVKEPKQILVITPTSDTNQFGFGGDQSDPVYQYITESGAFPAIVKFSYDTLSPLDPEIKVRVFNGPVTIKVQQACYDYMMSGSQTRHFLIDDKTFFLDGEPRRQLFLNGTYYMINLRGTK